MIWMVVAEVLPDAFKEASPSHVASAATLSVASMEALGAMFQNFGLNYKKLLLATKMESWALSKRKSRLYWPLMLVMILVLMVGQTEGDCTKEERKALLEIKASHMNSKMDNFLPTWVDYGGGDCCDWERVTCNTTTGHVTHLSLGRLIDFISFMEDGFMLWPLNVSLFHDFKTLTSLNLSDNSLDKRFMKTGLARLSSLKKLEVLDLSWNSDFDKDILPPLMTLTSLKILDLSYCFIAGTFEYQGSERVSVLRKLTTLNLKYNGFNESVITSLSTFSSLTKLDLSGNELSGPFPSHGLSHLTNLEELDLSHNQLNDTPVIQACKSLSRLKQLESINLSFNQFSNKSIISCLSSLPSLKILDLTYSFRGESSFPFQEILNLSNLEVFLLSANGFNGTIPMEAFTSLHHLRVLDLSLNNFSGSIPSTIQALSSLQAVSLAGNNLNGSLSDHGFCESKNLHELDLSNNLLDGNLPQCFKSLSSLKLLDISSNRFTGILVPSLIANLTSLEYIDFSHNKFEGSFLFSSFSNHTKLELVQFISDNDRFEVETEEPIDWTPMFQLKVLVLSNCIMNMHKGRVVPGFLLHQYKLRELDMSHNSLEGQFPNWLIKNNTNLEVLSLRNNFFGSIPLYRNTNMKFLDMSGNHMMGNIPDDIPKFFPNIESLNLSRNALRGAIPSSIGDLSGLLELDLSDNKLSGEVPKGLFTNLSQLYMLKLSENKLHGQVLSGNVSWASSLQGVYLDSNHFTGKIGIMIKEKYERLDTIDISNNFFTGMIPDWVGNMSWSSILLLRNNSFEGRFPCGTTFFSFLDISHNSFSGPIISCTNLQNTKHLHLGYNRFTGSIPNSFRNLTNVLTLDIGNNDLSDGIPKFLGELTTLRILILRKNNFSGSIPKQLCKLRDVSLLDLSKNSLSGSIPSCLQNITGPSDLAFFKRGRLMYLPDTSYHYGGILWTHSINVIENIYGGEAPETQDEVEFATKKLFLHYKGDILDYMTGLDLSCNKLTGEIPAELGLVTQLRALNLSHNQLSGPIPVNFSNLEKIESLDLSSNGLTGKVPSELVKLNFLSTFNVSHNHLSGRLPERTAQFGTFTEASYEGNPLLCGPPLKKNCSPFSQVTNPSAEEEDNETLYDIDMTCFYGSSISTCVVLLLGFVAVLYINPHWRRRWLDWVEDCMCTCYYFLYDLITKPSMIFRKWNLL